MARKPRQVKPGSTPVKVTVLLDADIVAQIDAYAQQLTAEDPIRRITVCPLGLPTHGTRLCPLHKRMDDALAAIEGAFAGTTLAELLAEPTTSIPLCDSTPSGGRRVPLPVKRQ